jgi:ABC-type transporter Mla subunit MlaD
MLRKSILVLIILVGLATIATLFINPLRYSRQDIKTCFDDAGGLQAGASIRIAGVDVGSVRSVRADPQNKNCPAEIEMAVSTTYEIRIPKDSITRIETEGILSGVYLSIDTTHASGAPIENYGYLKGESRKPTLSLEEQLKAADFLIGLIQQTREAGTRAPEDGGPLPHQPVR